MKYFGEKSLSSLMAGILKAGWIIALICSIGMVVGGIVYVFILPYAFPDFYIAMHNVSQMSPKDLEGWKAFNETPIVLKALMFPYLLAVVYFLLKVLKKSQQLFVNFRNNTVFDTSNVEVIRQINRNLIIFAVLTFNLSSLLLCVLLMMVCELFKNGAKLQEEHNLTI